jgi:branched-chain amino acid transport system substrate-binding protein
MRSSQLTGRAAAGLALILALAGCGTRVDYDDLRQAATAVGGAPTTAAAPGAAVANPTAPSPGQLQPAAQSGSRPQTTGIAGTAPPEPGHSKGGTPPDRTTTPGAPTSSNVCTAPRSTIAIGSVGQQSGVAGQIQAPGPQAVKAWAASVNAAGGLYCHQIKYYVGDDAGDPSRNQALVREFVEHDGVVAFVHNDSALAGDGSVPYLTEHKIPVIGTSTGEPAGAWASPMYFPQAVSGLNIGKEVVAAAGTTLVPQGKTKLASLLCVEAPLCSSFQPYLADWAKEYGLDLVYKGSASLVQPDFTASCQAAKSAGAQILLIGLDQSSILRVVRSCAAVNFHPIVATSGVLMVGNTVRDSPLLDQTIVASGVAPWFGISIPGVAQFADTMNKFAPGVLLSGTGMLGYTSAQLFAYVTQFVPDNPTSQDYIDALYRVHKNDLAGITTDLTFTKSAANQVNQKFCFWTVQVRNKQWTSPNNFARTCS